MALTRKMLVAMEIPAEKIDEIINAHAETVEALKAERDDAQRTANTYKADAELLPSVQKELDDLKSSNGKNPFEDKYNATKAEYDALKKEYDDYKNSVEEQATKQAKENAYKELLKEAGISDKRIDSILKITDLNSIDADKDGAIKNKDTLLKSIKEEWSDFIVTENNKGADTPNPQQSSSDNTAPRGESRAARIAAQYHNNLYGESKKEA